MVTAHRVETRERATRPALIELSDVRKVDRTGKLEYPALRGVEVTIEIGDIVAVAARSEEEIAIWRGQRVGWGPQAQALISSDVRGRRWYTSAEVAARARVAVLGRTVVSPAGTHAGDSLTPQTPDGPVTLKVIGISRNPRATASSSQWQAGCSGSRVPTCSHVASFRSPARWSSSRSRSCSP